ncbi:MAG: hypothetical protein GY861_17580 [bacterium]|nr:hypothetical protein [bacterium]
MVQAGETKVFLMENASTQIFNHVEKEISATTVDGAETDFEVLVAPVSVTGIVAGSPQPQYVDADDDYFRKDVLVFYRKDGLDTVVDTGANAITISGTTITFAAAPTTSEADSVVVSSSHTPSNRTDEIVNLTPAGGARPVEFVTVQGGDKVRIEKVQEQKTIAFEVLSVDGGFVHFVNGGEVEETIAGATSGSDILKGTVGAQTRTPRTIVTTVTDPETSNSRIECFFNVVGVSDEGAAPSDGYWSETCGFECAPQDYCRLTRLVGQG